MTTDRPGRGFDAAATRFENKVAIYKTDFHASRVRVVDVRVAGDELHASLQPIETPGLNGAEPPFQISARRSLLRMTMSSWMAADGRWWLFFDPTVIARVVEIVAALPEGRTSRNDYTVRPSTNPKFVTVTAPGPIAAQLMGYLREQSCGKPENFLEAD
jgi:hypothetical protein